MLDVFNDFLLSLNDYSVFFLSLASIINSCTIGYVLYHVLKIRGDK